MLKDNWSGAESLFSSVSSQLVSCAISANGNTSPLKGHGGNVPSGPKATAAGNTGNAGASPQANPNRPAPSLTYLPTSASTPPFSGYLLAMMITYPIAGIFGILWYRSHKRDVSRQAIKGSAA